MRENKEIDAGVPTISRVCSDTLVELVYDTKSKKTALAVSRYDGLWNIEQEVRVETGEFLVPYHPRDNLIASGCVLLPEKPAEYYFKPELIADIRDFLHRYVDLSEQFELVAAYYILLTWVYDAFNELPYLRLRGDYGTGKTRALLALGSLCYRPFFASGASTTSPIFHTQDLYGGTLVLDEADFPQSDARADLVKLLNNGNVRGMPVLRSVMNRNREFSPHAFKVFGPKIVAMRGEFQDQALSSRFMTEETGTRQLRQDIPIALDGSFEREALQLRNRLLHFRFCEYYKIKSDPAALMRDAEPRLNQTSLPLLSLIDEAEERSQVQSWLLAQYQDLKAERAESDEAHILRAICDAHAASRGPVSLAEVSRRFHAADGGHVERRSNKWIGYLVRARLRLRTERIGGTYTVPASECVKAVAMAPRYGIG